MRLPQLKVLCLNHNRVERLAPPPELERGVVFPSLQVLHLAYNQLTSLLPLQLHHFTALRALFLQGKGVGRGGEGRGGGGGSEERGGCVALQWEGWVGVSYLQW